MLFSDDCLSWKAGLLLCSGQWIENWVSVLLTIYFVNFKDNELATILLKVKRTSQDGRDPPGVVREFLNILNKIARMVKLLRFKKKYKTKTKNNLTKLAIE